MVDPSVFDAVGVTVGDHATGSKVTSCPRTGRARNAVCVVRPGMSMIQGLCRPARAGNFRSHARGCKGIDERQVGVGSLRILPGVPNPARRAFARVVSSGAALKNSRDSSPESLDRCQCALRPSRASRA